MMIWLVSVGVPVAAFAALVAGVWRHRAARHHGRHVAPTGAISRDVHDYTVPIAHTRNRPPWDDAPEPGPGWVADLRAALDEVEPSGWVKPELHHILAAPLDSGPLDDYAGAFGDVDTWLGYLSEPEPMVPEYDWPEPEPSRLADTADHAGVAMALDVADYMAAQDADATRYGGDLADWCAGQLRELRETLCPRR